ncbi:MAG: bifunctional DNA-formamidopyrimidine glycosylase/DNA-(apurinic or apyrimidinic site) lyase [Gemmatimonadota bacterium]
MPELPEVETIRRDLEAEIVGRRVVGVRIHKPDILIDSTGPAAFARHLHGHRIDAVERRGKTLILRLDGGMVTQVQLRMSGRFVLGHARPDPAEFRHIAAELDLDDGRTLFYDDTRRLGGLRLLGKDEWEAISGKLGPEPLAPEFRPSVLRRILGASRAPIKNALLDQYRIAGIGNIYASEALHRARIDPRRAANSLQVGETRRLHTAIRRVLKEALEAAGTTFRDYRAVNGRSGEFQARLRVYGREGEPCTHCRRPIERIVQAGRSTYFCPRCQG